MRNVAPRRCAEVCARTSARTPRLSMVGTWRRSTSRSRRTVAEQRLHPLLELLGGPPCDERLLRRQDDPTADRVLGNGHVNGCADYNMRIPEPVAGGRARGVE